MYKRPLRLQSGSNPSPPPEAPAQLTLDQHGLPPAGWDKRAKASLQGGARAAARHAQDGVLFKSAGPSGTITLKKR